jgi:hypothetical protein
VTDKVGPTLIVPEVGVSFESEKKPMRCTMTMLPRLDSVFKIAGKRSEKMKLYLRNI